MIIIMMCWSKNKKKIKKILLKIFNFYNLRKMNILHGRDYVMRSAFYRTLDTSKLSGKVMFSLSLLYD